MVIRAKPKYITSFQVEDKDFSQNINKNELFFSQGRAALKFFLVEYIKFYGVHPKVCLQSFNCHAVIDACLEAGVGSVTLMDIKDSDFSINYNDLISMQDIPDIVILTHYQGIPNLEYIQIVKYCQKKNILLIEDMAQTELSTVENVQVGSLGNVVLRSFAFDKPVSVFEGGSLELLYLDNEFQDSLLSSYCLLPKEPIGKAYKDLEKLKRKFYKNRSLSEKLKSFIISLLTRWFCGKKTQIQILRLNEHKLPIVLQQRSNMIIKNPEVRNLERFLEAFSFPFRHYKGCEICWNRYAVLDTTGKLKQLLNRLGVEASNYNWPIPLHKQYAKHPRVIFGQLKNTEFVAQSMVNIPVWSDFFSKSYLDK